MGDPEGVVDVGVVPVDQLLDEVGVVALFTGVEPQVLQQLDLGRQAGQLLADRAEVPLGVGRALGPAQMGAGGDPGPSGQQVLEGGDGRPGSGSRR